MNIDDIYKSITGKQSVTLFKIINISDGVCSMEVLEQSEFSGLAMRTNIISEHVDSLSRHLRNYRKLSKLEIALLELENNENT